MVNDPELVPIRLSHLLGHSGVGAVVRGPDGLFVVMDTRFWKDRDRAYVGRSILYVERVRAALGIDQDLREPPAATMLSNGVLDGSSIPAMHFPSWSRCPACSFLYHVTHVFREDGTQNCPHCDKRHRPEQVTWVLADSSGRLAEVPWHYLAHRDARAPAQRECKVYNKMALNENANEPRLLVCAACNCKTPFLGDERLDFANGPIQPWTRTEFAHASHAATDQNKAIAQVLAINDSRLYSPVSDSALVIPPESRVRKGTVVDRLYRNSEDRRRIDEALNPLARKSAIKEIAAKYRCAAEQISAALDDIVNGYPLYGATFTPGQLRESEYDAFLETLPDQQPDEDLVTFDQTEQWRLFTMATEFSGTVTAIAQSVQHLVRINRLKAVKVFKGFTRLGGDSCVPPDLVGNSSWLPALELFGEGIFLTLDEKKLAEWESNEGVISRLRSIQARFRQSGRDQPNPLTARFLLLHTLSHLLMRQIESEGGYPAASLSERIYSAHTPRTMAGILIYVTVPDIAGSLGGIAELSEPRRFLGILTRSLEHAEWCSLDPVCSEHEGQGPGLLNRAACHACALVPEPACEYGNTLLDRCFVKGSEELMPGYFK